MLQHRQALKTGDLCAVSDEHILFSDCDEQSLDNALNVRTMEAMSGYLTAPLVIPMQISARNTRYVASRQHVISYDYVVGHYTVVDRTNNRVVAELNKRPPPHAYIACSCASQLSDGIFFFSYGTSAGTEDVRDNLWQVHAVLASEETATISLAFLTDFKGSGFAEKPQGRIVSLHCHPSKQYLFVVYSKGTVQVWSYAKCYQHLVQQQQRGLGSGPSQSGFGDASWGAAGAGVSGTGSTGQGGVDGGDAAEEEEEAGNDDASEAGSVQVGASAGGTGSSRSAAGLSTGKGGLFAGMGPSAKHVQARLLKAVANFALPTNAQLMRLDPEYETLVLCPSSFRLDAHGRFAAVVWSERIMCVYDIYTLLMLGLLQKPQNKGAAASAPINVVQLSIFGAFPCKAVAHAAGVEYSLGPMTFHPSAQVVFVTVLRHRQAPRMQLSARPVRDTLTLPLSPLIYAVSLAVHQPILSSIGSYEVGRDLDHKLLSGSSSINWRPQSVDCTAHSGLLVVTFSMLSMARPGASGASCGVDDVDADAPSAAFTAALAAEDAHDLSLAYGGDSSSAALGGGVAPAGKTNSLALLYGLSAAWLRTVGILNTSPICSPLPVPPDAYLYGEGVMNARASYTQRTQEGPAGSALAIANATQSFALTENASSGPSSAGSGTGSGSGDISDSYPLLLTLRAAFDGSDEGLSVNAIVVNYHIFRTHWAFPHLGSASSNSNNSNNNGAGGAKTAEPSTSTATHIGCVPAVLTSAVLAQAAEASSAWAQLPAEHHLSLTGWEDEAQDVAQNAHIAHTYYPLRLITKESIGLTSLIAASDATGATGAAGACGWDALLVGTVRRSVASSAAGRVAESADINTASAARGRACVSLLHYSDVGAGGAPSFSVVHTNYRDAAYFQRGTEPAAAALSLPSSLPPAQPSASAGGRDVSVLVLSHCGRQLHVLTSSPAGGDAAVAQAGKLVAAQTFELGGEMSALWTAPAGAPNVVLFASAVDAAMGQTLYASPADPTAQDFAAVGDTAAPAADKSRSSSNPLTFSGGTSRDRSVCKLALAPGETVLEASWQPLPSAVAKPPAGLSGPALALLQESQQIWLCAQNESLLALRTTHRVLICTNKLEVLNSDEYCRIDSPRTDGARSVGSTAGTDGLVSGFLQRLLSPQQTKVSRSTAAKESTGPAALITDTVTGIIWLGAALCYTSESGAVHFLLPAPCVLGDASATAIPAASPIFRAMGVRMLRSAPLVPARYPKHATGRSTERNETDRGLLCTLPRNISTTLPGSHRILAVLSDRALVSYLRRDDAYHSVTPLHQVTFTQRPLNPLEPLVLGLIALGNLRGRRAVAQMAQQRADAVDVLMSYYVSPRTENTAAAGGARPSSQCSRRLSLAITQYQAQRKAALATGASAMQSSVVPAKKLDAASAPKRRSAAIAAGLHSQQARSAGCGEFPIMRWVPSGFKFYVAAQSGLLKLAALELLSSRVELQELVLDSESYAGNAVPHVHRPLSAQLAAAALHFLQISVRSSSTDKDHTEMLVSLARRLTDIAGDYSSLTGLVLRDRSASGASTGKRAEADALAAVAAIAEEQLLPGDRAAYLRLLAHIADNTGKASVRTNVRDLLRVVLQERLNLGALGCTTRKKNLTASATSALPEGDAAATTALSQAEGAQKEHFARTGNAQGPPLVLSAAISSSAALTGVSTVAVLGPRAMGLLALDLLEDFMGVNLQLEMCSTTTSDLTGGDGAAAETATISSGGLYMGSAVPESWMEGVGVGSKEHEHIMAYYRFSDVAYQNEDGFYCSSLEPAGSRLVFTDLSRFEGPGLELYSTTSNSLRVEYSTSAVDPGEKHDNVKSLCDVVYSYCAAQGEDGVVPAASQHGLRCPVPRGSQLDIGMYHEDANRSRLTVELMVCFDEVVAQASAEAAGNSEGGFGANAVHVLLQRLVQLDGGEGPVLWTLFVTPDGAVGFAFGDGSSGKTAAVLKSAPDCVALPKAARDRSSAAPESSTWTHIAVVIDSSKASCTVADGTVTQAPVSVTLVVRGEPVEARLSPVPVPLAQLTKSTLHVGRNLPAGFRLTELRIWADARSLTDLDNMRDNYLVLAMKRKRLQLRVKGTKKLFTAYREIEVPAAACTTIKAPAVQDKAAAEEAEDKSAVSSALASGAAKGLPKALANPLSLKPAPAFAHPIKLETGGASGDSNATGSAAALTDTTNTAGSLADSSTAPAPTAAAPVMSARERRMSLLKGGATAVAAANAMSAPSKPSALSKPAKLTPQPQQASIPAQSPSASTPEVAQNGEAGKPVPESPPSKDTAAAKAGAETAAAHARVSFAAEPDTHKTLGQSAVTAPNLANTAAALVSKAATGTPGSRQPHSVADCCSTLANLSLLAGAGAFTQRSDFESYATAKPFAQPNYWMQCFLPKASAAGAPPLRGLYSMSLPHSPTSTTSTSAAEHSIAASLPADVQKATESAILTAPSAFGDAKALRLLAVLAHKSLSVYRTSADAAPGSAELVAQVSLAAVKLVFWAFISADMILMVSNSAGFTLKIAAPAASVPPATSIEVFKPKPVKIFDRIDLVDPLKWNERVILDLQVCADGWTLLVSCNRDKTAAEDKTAADLRQSLVSLYHAKSGKSVSFSAAAGCFRLTPDLPPQVLVVWKDANRMTSEPQWCVSAIALSDIHQYWTSSASSSVPAAGLVGANWKEALLLGAQCPLPVQWSLQLPNSDAETSVHHSVAAACLDTVSDPTQPSIRVTSRSTGDILSVSLKSFSKLLSAAQPAAKDSAARSADAVTGNSRESCAGLLHPAPQVHVWSIGKLLYVLTEGAVLHQCSASAAVPQYVGSSLLPLLPPPHCA